MATPTVVLYGDSMLARFNKPRILALEASIGKPVTVLNCAAGGWDSTDCARRAPALAHLRPDILVLSLGSNDCAPWKQVPVDAFGDNVKEIVATFSNSHAVGLLPPTIREVERPGLGCRTNADLDHYRQVLHAATDTRVDIAELLTGMPAALRLEDDGLHLTSASYDQVVPALAAAVSTGLAQLGRA